MKHLILKKEIQLGKTIVVPESTRLKVSLSELVNYMNFPTNKLAIKTLEQLFNENEAFTLNNFNTKFTVNQLLEEAGYHFKNEINKEPQEYLKEVEIAWDDFLRKMKVALMNVRYHFLEQRVYTNPSKLYQ